MNTLDYQIADTHCETIINDFDPNENVEIWLSKYKSLYYRFNIAPKGLPAVANCNFEGVKYDKIAKFHSLYSKTKYEYSLLDNMPHTEK